MQLMGKLYRRAFKNERRMKAAIYSEYGPPEVVRISQADKPTPNDDEVLVKILATTVTSGDWRARSLDLPPGFGLIGRLVFGVFGPRRPILGTELAGVIEAVGKDVTKFKVGDDVFAFSGARMGCHAEYRCLKEDDPIALKPPNLSYEEAAALSFGGTTAIDFFRRAGLEDGDAVLINGASGGVGTAAVQVAKHQGAVVTAVCSMANVELSRSLGADHTIDYTQEDFTQNGERFDIIVDIAGTAPYARSKHSLKPDGRLLLVLGSLSDLLRVPWVALTSRRRIIAGPAAERREDVQTLADLATSGHYNPFIDRRYSFDDIVAAHRHVDTGHKRGNVVVTL